MKLGDICGCILDHFGTVCGVGVIIVVSAAVAIIVVVAIDIIAIVISRFHRRPPWHRIAHDPYRASLMPFVACFCTSCVVLQASPHRAQWLGYRLCRCRSAKPVFEHDA